MVKEAYLILQVLSGSLHSVEVLQQLLVSDPLLYNGFARTAYWKGYRAGTKYEF